MILDFMSKSNKKLDTEFGSKILKLKKFEIAAIAIALLAAAFTGGYLAGSGDSDGNIRIEGLETVQKDVDAPSGADGTEYGETPEGNEAPDADQQAEAGAKVNINTATVAELETLPGIGEVLARRIVEYRENFGDFRSTEEIMEVSGIGDGKYEAIKDMITV